MSDIGGIGAEQLRSYIERIERLEEERAACAGDIREVYAEAKGNGFDTRTMRAIVRLRKLDSAERDEQEQLLDLYKHALGMAGTPLHDEGFSVEVKRGDGTKGTLSGPHPAGQAKAPSKPKTPAREPEAAAAS